MAMGAGVRETGFAETASLPGLIGPTGGEGQIGVFARKAWISRLPAIRRRPRLPWSARGYVMAHLCGQSGLGDRLASRIRAIGRAVSHRAPRL